MPLLSRPAVRRTTTALAAVLLVSTGLTACSDDNSGSGSVSNELVGDAVTMSESAGFIHDPDGITPKKLAFIMELKNVKRGRIKEYADKFGCGYFEDKTPWNVKCDVALPCATQNELNGEDAKALVSHGVVCVAEGANMPCTAEARQRFAAAGVPWARVHPEVPHTHDFQVWLPYGTEVVAETAPLSCGADSAATRSESAPIPPVLSAFSKPVSSMLP